MHRRRRWPLALGLALAFSPAGHAFRPAALAPIAAAPAADVANVRTAVRAGAEVPLRLDGVGVLRLKLRDSGVVSADTIFTATDAHGRMHRVPRPAFEALAGTVVGEEASTVRMTVTDRWIAGTVFTRGRWIAFGPDSYANPTRTVTAVPAPAPPGVRPAGRRAFDTNPGGTTRASAADPLPTPLPTTPTPIPSPTLPPTPTPTIPPTPTVPPTPLPNLSPLPPTTLPSPFPIAAPTSLPPVSAGALNCKVIRCNVITVKVILDADVFYRAIDPASCATRQIAMLNSVDAVYMLAATRIHLVTPQVNCRTTNDLGGPGTSADHVLLNLKLEWAAAEESRNRSIVHLSVGFDFGAGQVIGRGAQPGVCNRLQPDEVSGTDVPDVLPMHGVGPVTVNQTAGPVVVSQTPLRRIEFYLRCPNGYSLHQAVSRPNSNYNGPNFGFLEIKLASHEIGHNFNGVHPTSGCPETGTRNGEIMCDTLQEAGPNTFSPASAARIRDWAEQNAGSLTGS